MKKLMTLAALAACLPAFATAEVESSNTVGYTKLNLAAGLNMVGGQFISVGNSANNASDIQTFITGTLTTGDEIMFYDGSSYELFSYDDTMTFDENWNDLGAGWSDADGFRASRNITPSEGFWYRAVNAIPVTFSGEVSTENAIVETKGGLALATLPKPVSKDIQSISFTGISTGDEIMFYDGSSYELFSYDDTMTFDENWNDLGAGWSDADGFRASKVIDENTGFWLRSTANAVTISVD